MAYVRILLLLTSLTWGLTGCARTFAVFNNDNDSEECVLRAQKHFNSGNFDDAILSFTEAISKRGGLEVVKNKLKEEPKIQKRIDAYLYEKANKLNDKYMIIEYAGLLEYLIEHQIFDGAKSSYEMLVKRVAQSNLSDEIPWLLGDDIHSFPCLSKTEAQKLIFKRTLKHLGERSKNSSLLQQLADYLEKSDFEGDRLLAEDALRKVNLSRNELLFFENILPSLVQEQLKRLNIYIQVSSSERLLEEDIKERLKLVSQNYMILKHGESGNSDTIQINVEKLRLEERQLPGQSETITYAQHEVNLAAAILLMPRNASYMYEWSTGGVELEYAFLIKINKNSRTLLDELVRDTLTEKYVNCKNQRIVNVFGGSNPANFVANSDMQSRCSGAGRSPISTKDLRNRALTALIDRISSIKEISIGRE